MDGQAVNSGHQEEKPDIVGQRLPPAKRLDVLKGGHCEQLFYVLNGAGHFEKPVTKKVCHGESKDGNNYR